MNRATASEKTGREEWAVLLEYRAAMTRLRHCRRAVGFAARAVARGDGGADETLEATWVAERSEASRVERLRAALFAARATSTSGAFGQVLPFTKRTSAAVIGQPPCHALAS